MTWTNPTAFVNEFNQVINPGDAVLMAITCSHYTSIVKGKYLGVVDGPHGNLAVEYESHTYFPNKETGRWDIKVPIMKRTHLKRKQIYKYVD